MDVKEAIDRRRAYRSLDPVEMTDDILDALAESARLAPSCFNNQPWRFVFVHGPEALERLHEALSRGNDWARAGSMIIAVLAKKEDDCIIKDREYYLFDAGMGTAFLILRATELGLVAHPIAGYSPRKVRESLDIPDEMQVVALVVLGRHSDTVSPVLSEKQREAEKERPQRLPVQSLVFHDRYGQA